MKKISCGKWQMEIEMGLAGTMDDYIWIMDYNGYNYNGHYLFIVNKKKPDRMNECRLISPSNCSQFLGTMPAVCMVPNATHGHCLVFSVKKMEKIANLACSLHRPARFQ